MKIFVLGSFATAVTALESKAVDEHMEYLLHSQSEEGARFRSDLQWMMPLFGHFPNFTTQEDFPSSFLEWPGRRDRFQHAQQQPRRRPAGAHTTGIVARKPKEFNIKEACKMEIVPCGMRKSLIKSYVRKLRIADEIDGLEGVNNVTKQTLKDYLKKLQIDASQAEVMCKLVMTIPRAQEPVSMCGDFYKTCMNTIHSLCSDGLLASDGSCDFVSKGSCHAKTSKSCFCAGSKAAKKLPRVSVPEMPVEAIQAREIAQNRTAAARRAKLLHHQQVQERRGSTSVGH